MATGWPSTGDKWRAKATLCLAMLAGCAEAPTAGGSANGADVHGFDGDVGAFDAADTCTAPQTCPGDDASPISDGDSAADGEPDASGGETASPDAEPADAGADGLEPEAGADAASDADPNGEPDAGPDPDGGLEPDSDDAADAAEDVDTGPATAPVVFVALDPPVQAAITILDPGPHTAAVPVVSAADGLRIAYTPAGKAPAKTLLLGPLSGQAQPLEGAASAPVAALEVAGARLLWHADGLAVQVKNKLVPSPLQEAIGAPLAAWRKGGASDLWLIAGGVLWLWRGGVVAKLPLPDLSGKPMVPTALAHGCVGPAGSSIAVSGAHGLQLLHIGDGPLSDGPNQTKTLTLLQDRPVEAVVCDDKGVLWALGEGELFSRGVDGSWLTHSFALVEAKPAVVALRGLDGQPGFWVEVAGNTYRRHGDSWRLVLGLAAAMPKAAPAGAGLLTTPGLTEDHDGARVGAVDGVVLRVATSAPPPKPKVSWAKQIQPIYLASCALCHGPDGVATKLDTAKKWQDKYDKVWQLIDTGSMPLPPKLPLTSSAKALVAKWKSDGFQP